VIGAKSVVMTIWWAAQWPILAVFLLVAFTGILRSGPAAPNGDSRGSRPTLNRLDPHRRSRGASRLVPGAVSRHCGR
jgi:hypothetical protein